MPLAHALPVETAKPALSSFTTQRARQSPGSFAETVFQRRASPSPRIVASGILEMKSSRMASLAASSPLARDASRWASAAIIESTPATFSVPARRPSSCGPPTSCACTAPLGGHFRNPTPVGPPNLWAQPLTKSHSPKPAAGSLPTHCAASQKNGIPCSLHNACTSRHGCSTPVSLFAAITAMSPGRCRVISRSKYSKSKTPPLVTGSCRCRSPKCVSVAAIRQGCSMAETQTSASPGSAFAQ